MDYPKYIGVIKDFPKAGISFKDISPLLRDPKAFRSCIDDMAKLAEPFHADVLLAPESRGFIYAAAMAYPMNLGMVMARKPGKLPGHNLSVSYTLEYGQETLEIREDSFKKGQRVLLVDDLLATGGSLQALSDLVKKAGAVPVGAVVMIRLQELEGEKAVDVPVRYLFNLSAKK